VLQNLIVLAIVLNILPSQQYPRRGAPLSICELELFDLIKKKKIFPKPNIAEIHQSKVTFSDGTTVVADAILLCTGYVYKYPFLADSIVTSSGHVVQPLYKHLFYSRNPTMCFPGLLRTVLPLPLMELQVLLCTKCFRVLLLCVCCFVFVVVVVVCCC